MTPVCSLAEAARRLGGRLRLPPGADAEAPVSGVAEPEGAGAGDLVFAAEKAYRGAALASAALAVVLPEADAAAVADRAVIGVPNVRLAMAEAFSWFLPPAPPPGRHPTAVVAAGASVDPSAALGPYVVIGEGARVGAGSVLEAGVVLGRGARVGAGCRLHPHVVLYDGVRLGDRVVVHAHTVLGSDGYGFTPDAGGNHVKIPQLGGLTVGDDVELGALCAVDRGTLGDTAVGAGAKLDNLIHLGHNVKLGEKSLVVSQTGVSGSTAIGPGCVLAGQVGVAGHLEIGAGSWILARSGVTKSLPAGSYVSGFPARPHREALKAQAQAARLEARLKALEAEVAALRASAQA